MSSRRIPHAAWVPAGVDPTEVEYPMQGPSCLGCLGRIFTLCLWLLGAYGLLSLASGALAQPEPTATPTETVAVEILPISTPMPQSVDVTLIFIPTMPTSTPVLDVPMPILETPTWTPTVPATPTARPIIATWTPGPWLLTRHATLQKR